MIKLALIQLQRKQDREENLRRVFSLVKEQEADVILLPENWLCTEAVPFDQYLSLVRKIVATLSSDTLLAAGAQYVEEGGQIISRGVFACHGSKEFVCYEKCFHQ